MPDGVFAPLGQSTAALHIEAKDLLREGGSQRIMERLSALEPPELKAFLARNESCERLNTCMSKVAAKVPTHSILAPQSRKALKARAVWLAKWLAGFLLYALVARVVGNKRAATITAVVAALGVAGLAVMVAPDISSQGSRSLGDLIFFLVVLAAIPGVPLVLACGYWFFYELVFGLGPFGLFARWWECLVRPSRRGASNLSG